MRDYLEQELGVAKMKKAYDKFKQIGEEIYFSDNENDMFIKLEGVLTVEEIKKYQMFFAGILFDEEQVNVSGGGAKQENSSNGFGGGANLTGTFFGPRDDCSSTANFGK